MFNIHKKIQRTQNPWIVRNNMFWWRLHILPSQKNLLDELKSARFLWRDNRYSTKKYILTRISAKHFRANSYPTYSAYPTYGNASLYILKLRMNKTTSLKYLSRLGATGFAAATFCLFIATVSSGKLHFIFNIQKYLNKVFSF